MLIYGVKISDIKKYNEQKAERFFEILQKTNASNIAEKYFLDKTKIDGTFGDFLSNFDDGCGNYGAAACLKEIIENIEGILREKIQIEKENGGNCHESRSKSKIHY